MHDSIALHASGLFTFEQLFSNLTGLWLEQPEFDRGEVHAQKVTQPEMVTKELRNVTVGVRVPRGMDEWQTMIHPNLPWAENHFDERVGGRALNPPPSEEYWPHAQQGNSAHKKGKLFSHTYPERFWPKRAGHQGQELKHERMGIRFAYGDLEDLVNVLKKNPKTRQAYLPVWFPEDLDAARRGERVPCTLGYHFLYTPDRVLDVTYHMRSCDLFRFFRDDVYMAGRLLQWVSSRVGLSSGKLRMHIASLHAFVGDVPIAEALVKAQAEADLLSRVRPKAATRANYDFGSML